MTLDDYNRYLAEHRGERPGNPAPIDCVPWCSARVAPACAFAFPDPNSGKRCCLPLRQPKRASPAPSIFAATGTAW